MSYIAKQVDSFKKNLAICKEEGSRSRYLELKDSYFINLLSIIQKLPVRSSSQYEELEEFMDYLSSKNSERLRVLKMKQFGLSILAGYLNNSVVPTESMLLRILTCFNPIESEQVALHHWKAVEEFICGYLANNNNYYCYLLFQVVDIFSKEFLNLPHVSQCIINGIVNLFNNKQCSFLRLFGVGMKTNVFTVPHLWNVMFKLCKNGGLDEYFKSIIKEIQLQNCEIFSNSFKSLLSQGEEMIYHSSSNIENPETLLTYLDFYVRLMVAISENELGRQILSIDIFRSLFINSLKRIDKMRRKLPFCDDSINSLNKLSLSFSF